MRLERDSRFQPSVLIALFLAAVLFTLARSATMALAARDRKIAELTQQKLEVEAANRLFLSSLLSGANGGSYSVEFNQDTSVFVDCKIAFEWVDGKYFEGDSGRRIPKPKPTPKHLTAKK